jgi:acetyltransferase-like isoleucine patch superfamily enzyme
MRGAQVGRHVNLGDHAFVESGATIGDNVTIKNQVCIWEGVTIEDDVFVGPRVTFTNDVHPRSPRMTLAKERYSDRKNWLVRTLVRQGCSIGAGAVICPGVTLGKYSMVGAGAVVTKDVPPFAMVVGVPAHPVRDVCMCGQPLDGVYQLARCDSCGQTGSQRIAILEHSKAG